MFFGFKDISISYGHKEIVEDINLEFEKGKIYSLIGKNGCGKTSLLKLVSRVVHQKKGDVILEDKSLKEYSGKEIAKKIAYVSQYHDTISDVDVKTLVSFGRYPYIKLMKGMTEADRNIVDECIELTNLTHLATQSLNTLSGGERQRAWIAMALAQKTEILILDEPTTYLDIHFQIELLDLIKELNKKLGITIIMVLHELNLASRYSDYLYSIKDKKTFKCGTVDEVFNKEVIGDIFDVEAVITRDEIHNCPYFIPFAKKKDKTTL